MFEDVLKMIGVVLMSLLADDATVDDSNGGEIVDESTEQKYFHNTHIYI